MVAKKSKVKKSVPKVKKVPEKIVIDCFTGEKVNLSDSVSVSTGIIHKKYLVKDIYNNSFSIKDSNVVIDCVNKTYYVDKRNSQRIMIGGTLDNQEHGYTYNAYGFPHIKYQKTSRTDANVIISEELAIEIGLKESVYDGCYYDPKGFNPSTSPIKYAKFDGPAINRASKQDLIKFGVMSPTHLISEGKKYSFGIELETSGGYVPDYIAKDLNMSCVFDGSIRDNNGNKGVGGEYVTGVLRGDNGLRHLYKITNELSKRCSINNTCSVHVHLGGLDFNKELIVMLWKINQLLEAELYSMMPKSRMSREHCRGMKHIKFDFNKKDMSYTMLIDKYYDQIFKIISLGKSPSKTVNKKYNHPAGHSCGYDTKTPRYWWINFVPAMFNLKGEDSYTIEYRMHSASLNFTKIKNWILIVKGITHVAENHKNFIINNDKITLADVMKLSYPSKGDYLIRYIEERKSIFNTPNDYMSERAEYIINRDIANTSKTLKETSWD